MRLSKGILLFWGIVAVVLGVQFSGMGFGLPQQYHPDEYYVNISTFKLFREIPDLNFEKTRYVLGVRWIYFAEFAGAFVVGRALKIYPSFAAFYQGYFASGNPYVDAAPPLFYLLPRLVSFLFYTGCILLVFAIVKKFTKDTPDSRLPYVTALTALLLPAGYLYAHYGTRESAICFMCLLLVYHAFFYFDALRLKSIITGGVLLGLALGIKENAAIFYFLYAFLVWSAFRQKQLPLSRLFVYLPVLAMLMLAVFFLLNPQRLGIHHVQAAAVYYQQSSVPVFSATNSHWIYPTAFMHEFSLPGLILLVLGVGVAWFLRPQTRILTAIMVGTYLVLDCMSGSGPNKADRFIMNIFLPMLIIGLLGLAAGLAKIKKEKYVWLLPLVILAFNAQELFSVYWSLNGHDTRDDAKAWIAKNIPQGARVARETIYAPSVDPQQCTVLLTDWILGGFTLDSLQRRGIQYLIMSDQFQAGWMGGQDVKNNYTSFKPYIIKTFTAEHRPQMNDFHSPQIMICKIQ